MNIKSAIERARTFASKFSGGEDVETTLHTWSRKGPVGVRVAELSYWKPDRRPGVAQGAGAGCSFMSSDPDGLAVCAAIERLILCYYENEDIEHAESVVEYLLTQEGTAK